MEKAKTVLAVGGIVFSCALLAFTIYSGVKAIQANTEIDAITEKYNANEVEFEEYTVKMNELNDQKADYVLDLVVGSLAITSFGLLTSELTKEL